MLGRLNRFDRMKLGSVLAIVLGAVGYAITLGYDDKLLRSASVVAMALGICSIVTAMIGAYSGRWLAAVPHRQRSAQFGLTATLFVLAALAPWYIEDIPHGSLLKLTVAITFMMVILGLNLLTGFGGQISLGHSAFFAVGGYTTAIMNKEWGISWGYSIPVAAILAGVVGFLFGLPALRLKGLYLALATLALAVCVAPIAKKFDDFTGGVQGIVLFGKINPLFGDKADKVVRDRFFYYTVAIVASILFLIAWNLMRGRFGRALVAIRDSETAAAAMGVNVALYKTTIFGISAAYAGVAGALNAAIIGFVSPDQYSLTLSIKFLVGAVVGGVASIAGAIFGGLFQQFTPDYTADINKAAPDAIFAVILIVMMYVMPSGISGYVHRVWRYGVDQLRWGEEKKAPATPSVQSSDAGSTGGPGGGDRN
jgi:branched-chain amino acid transport system permease protein